MLGFYYHDFYQLLTLIFFCSLHPMHLFHLSLEYYPQFSNFSVCWYNPNPRNIQFSPELLQQPPN